MEEEEAAHGEHARKGGEQPERLTGSDGGFENWIQEKISSGQRSSERRRPDEKP